MSAGDSKTAHGVAPVCEPFVYRCIYAMQSEVEPHLHRPERGAARKILLFIIQTTIRSGSIQPIESKLNQPI